jgi:hypothetical protein
MSRGWADVPVWTASCFQTKTCSNATGAGGPLGGSIDLARSHARTRSQATCIRLVRAPHKRQIHQSHASLFGKVVGLLREPVDQQIGQEER